MIFYLSKIPRWVGYFQADDMEVFITKELANLDILERKWCNNIDKYETDRRFWDQPKGYPTRIDEPDLRRELKYYARIIILKGLI
jgi:hypothetical protein